MPGLNSSQDPDYEGPVGHEKKLHKTHFPVAWKAKRVHPKDDPNWVYVGVGRWKWINPKKRVTRGRRAGGTHGAKS